MEDGTIFKPGDIQGMFDFIQGIRYSGDDIKNMARFVGVEGLKDGGSDTELVMLLFQHLSGRVRPLGKDTKSGAAEETSILLGSIDESIGGLGGELSRSVPVHPVSSMKEVGDETGHGKVRAGVGTTAPGSALGPGISELGIDMGLLLKHVMAIQEQTELAQEPTELAKQAARDREVREVEAQKAAEVKEKTARVTGALAAFSDGQFEKPELKCLRDVNLAELAAHDMAGHLLVALQADGQESAVQGVSQRLFSTMMTFLSKGELSTPHEVAIEIVNGHEAATAGKPTVPFSDELLSSRVYKRARAKTKAFDEHISAVIAAGVPAASTLAPQLDAAIKSGGESMSAVQHIYLALKRLGPSQTQEAVEARFERNRLLVIQFPKLTALAPVLRELRDHHDASAEEMRKFGLGPSTTTLNFMVARIEASSKSGGWWKSEGDAMMNLMARVRTEGDITAGSFIESVDRLDAHYLRNGGVGADTPPAGTVYLVEQGSGGGGGGGGGAGRLHGKSATSSPGGHRSRKPRAGASDGAKATDDVVCMNCYELGHYKSQCTNEVVCRHCSKPGHIKPNCPDADKPATEPLNFVAGGAGRDP